MCYDCNLRMSKRRVQEVRDARWAEESANYEFVAVYGKTTLTAATFVEIGDLLIGKGFNMAAAESMGALTLKVPHTNKKREAAAVRRVTR